MPRFTESTTEILARLVGNADPAGALVGRVERPGTFAAVASAYLAQFVDPKRADVAIDALRESGFAEAFALAEADMTELAERLREGGAASVVKLAGPLSRLARWFAATFDAEPDDGSTSTESLRESLRAIKGVGLATTDAILLHGLARPAYPVDRASYRIMVRHGWLDQGADYDEARSLIESALPDDPAALARLSDAFERLGQTTCRASVAKCDRCPLRDLLPEGGPLGDA